MVECTSLSNKIVGNVGVSQNKEILKMENDKISKENPYVCKEVLDQVGKPENFHMCKGLNVYDNRYRVNIFVREEVEDLTGYKLYISNSYFCKLEDDVVTILS